MPKHLLQIFWGVNGDFVSLVVESHLLTDFGILCLFASSLIEDVL